MILTDQQTYSTLGTYKKTQCQTPYLDQFANESIVFDQAYTVCPICTPARASIQTGVYPSKHGMMTNIYTKGCTIHELKDDETLLSRRLISQGYSVGYTGKWHLGAGKDESILGGVEYPWLADLMKFSGLPSDVGYEGDDFPGHGGIGDGYPSFREYLKSMNKKYTFKIMSEDYPRAAEITSGVDTTVPHYLVNRTIDHLSTFMKRDKPFFYMLNFWQPHEPYYVPTEFLDLYRDMEIDPWETYGQSTEGLPMIHNVERSLQGDWNKVQEYVRYYYASISHIDAEIGRLFDVLKKQGIYDDLIIIFSADHGETLGVHKGLTDKGLDMYEETIHIPLMFKLPGQNHQRVAKLIQTCDLYSTILDLAGLDRECAERDGMSILRLFESDSWRKFVVSESSGLDFMSYTQRMIRDDRFKFVFHVGGVDELYDLENDPYEKVNLSCDPLYAPKCIDMLIELRRWLINHHDGLFVRYDNLYHAKINHYQTLIHHD